MEPHKQACHHCELCQHLGSFRYTPALCLGSFSSWKLLNLSLWGSLEKRRQKPSPRTGIDVAGKTKCCRGDFPGGQRFRTCLSLWGMRCDLLLGN